MELPQLPIFNSEDASEQEGAHKGGATD